MAKIGSCKLEKGYCYLIDNYQSKLKVNTKTDCREYRISYKKKRNKAGSTMTGLLQGRIDMRPDKCDFLPKYTQIQLQIILFLLF
jgi:hypothetical protein